MERRGIDKVILREVENADFDLVFKWENDQKNWLYSGIKTPYSETEIREYVCKKQSILEDGQMRFMILDANLQMSVGCVDLFEYNAENKSVGVGILIDEDYQGQKYGSKALNLLEEICKEKWQLEMMRCTVLAENIASRKLFEKNNFKKTNTNVDNYRYLDKLYTQIIYQKKI